MAKMPFGTTGGKLHNVCPTSGRFGTETVVERQEARTRSGATGQQQQQQTRCDHESGCPNPPVTEFGLRLDPAAGITDLGKCRSHQRPKQQGD